MSERFDVLERFAPLFGAPELSFEEFLRRRDRRRRNRRVAAGVVGIAVFLAPVALFGVLRPVDHPRPAAQPGDAVDAALVVRINRCERIVITRSEVWSALGFVPRQPGPLHSLAGTDGDVPFGCAYSPSGGSGGEQVVITAYTTDAPPGPLGRARPVRGLGDEAEFTRWGNADGHVDGSARAASILQVRGNHLILRVSGGVFTGTDWHGYDLASLWKLAESALARAAAGGKPRVPAPSEPTLNPFVKPYFLDLRTGAKSTLPQSIVRTLLNTYSGGQFVASPDGTRLAYTGPGDDGNLQVFVAGVDGTGVGQVTHDPVGAASPAWSLDGTRIVYVGSGNAYARDLFVLDLATGETTQLTDDTLVEGEAQFTRGGSIIYSDGYHQHIQTLTATGGRSQDLTGLHGALANAGNASMSPDGSLVTFLGGAFHGPGPVRWVANADGTGRRQIAGWVSNPAGTWSPDGTRIACRLSETRVGVVDVATGRVVQRAEGSGAVWVDDHTLLVQT